MGKKTEMKKAPVVEDGPMSPRSNDRAAALFYTIQAPCKDFAGGRQFSSWILNFLIIC
jgi:hypothetical protein